MAFRDVNPFVDNAGAIERGLDTGMRIAEYQRNRKNSINDRQNEKEALGLYANEFRALGSAASPQDYEDVYRRMSVDPSLSPSTRELSAKRNTGFGQSGTAAKPITGSKGSVEQTYIYDKDGNLTQYKIFDKDGDGIIDAGYEGAGGAVPASTIDPNAPAANQAPDEGQGFVGNTIDNLVRGGNPAVGLAQSAIRGASNLLFPAAEAATLDGQPQTAQQGQQPQTAPAQPNAAEQLGIQPPVAVDVRQVGRDAVDAGVNAVQGIRQATGIPPRGYLADERQAVQDFFINPVGDSTLQQPIQQQQVLRDAQPSTLQPLQPPVPASQQPQVTSDRRQQGVDDPNLYSPGLYQPDFRYNVSDRKIGGLEDVPQPTALPPIPVQPAPPIGNLPLATDETALRAGQPQAEIDPLRAGRQGEFLFPATPPVRGAVNLGRQLLGGSGGYVKSIVDSLFPTADAATLNTIQQGASPIVGQGPQAGFPDPATSAVTTGISDLGQGPQANFPDPASSAVTSPLPADPRIESSFNPVPSNLPASLTNTQQLQEDVSSFLAGRETNAFAGAPNLGQTSEGLDLIQASQGRQRAVEQPRPIAPDTQLGKMLKDTYASPDAYAYDLSSRMEVPDTSTSDLFRGVNSGDSDANAARKLFANIGTPPDGKWGVNSFAALVSQPGFDQKKAYDFQREVNKEQILAAGGYQFKGSTLANTIRNYNNANPNSPISDDTIFTPEVQDKLFYTLADQKSQQFKEGRTGRYTAYTDAELTPVVRDIIAELGPTWAFIPAEDGTSYLNGNTAKVTRPRMESVVKDMLKTGDDTKMRNLFLDKEGGKFGYDGANSPQIWDPVKHDYELLKYNGSALGGISKLAVGDILSRSGVTPTKYIPSRGLAYNPPGGQR